MKKSLFAVILLGCSPGSLTEAEKQDFEAELERLYADDDAADDDAADDDAADDAADDDAADDDAAAPVLSACIEAVFDGCATSSCHDGTFQPALSGNGLVERLLGESTSCTASPKLIDPDAPENSLILQKVRGEQPSGCGVAMPFVAAGAAPLTAAEVTCIEDWFSSL